MLERTFVAVKHDGVQRGLIGEIIKRFEQRGLKLVGIKMVHPTEEQALNHYRLTDEWMKKLAEKTREAFRKKGIELKESDREIAERVRRWLVDYLREGPIVAMVWEGYHAIEIGRKIVGDTNPFSAPPGTIRGDFTVDSYEIADARGRPVRNIVHASGSKEEAENEINLWFSIDELFDWERHDWRVMH
ncbi:MAG: nucleoside-diphosphate kinase [Candidatus Aenigmatarchaeota archaeon]|nr:MAG: nucleoside-diphosphate kinase [Candidatus Aenigmarchaeota archaeon]